MLDPSLSRRAFLARAGVLGAAVAVAGGGVAAAVPMLTRSGKGHGRATSLTGNTPVRDVVDLLRPSLDFLAKDTLSGLAAFTLPGRDQYSTVQGTPDTTAGGIQARGAGFLAQSLDDFVPFPNEVARPIAAAFSTALSDLRLPNPLAGLPADLVNNLDNALSVLLNNDETIPLSLAVAILLNLVATQVNSQTTLLPGPDLSPFSRLSFAEKAKVFEFLEATDSNLVEALDLHLPQPLKQSASGLLKFVGGSLLEFAAFGCYNEWDVFDPATKSLKSRPVGWQITGYQPNGPGDGWDELRGYYQGRQKVIDI